MSFHFPGFYKAHSSNETPDPTYHPLPDRFFEKGELFYVSKEGIGPEGRPTKAQERDYVLDPVLAGLEPRIHYVGPAHFTALDVKEVIKETQGQELNPAVRAIIKAHK